MNILQGQSLFSGLHFFIVVFIIIIITVGLISAELPVVLIVYIPWRSKACKNREKTVCLEPKGNKFSHTHDPHGHLARYKLYQPLGY